MSGEKNLEKILASLDPLLQPGEYVFCSVTDPLQIDLAKCVAWFREHESFSVVMAKEDADDAGLEYRQTFSWIALSVHSSLEAVGLTAAFSTALSRAGISCNVVAAFYHDHIFVPMPDAQRAVDILKGLSD